MHEVAVETLFAAFADTGDPDALAAVFDQLAGKLLLVAAHLAGGGVAEDLVQATFVDAIRQRQRWDRARPLTPWLIGLLGNHVARARRERVRVPDPQRFARQKSEPAGAVAEANECFEAVATAVQALPRHYRQVLSLRLVHGLELQQIAHSLDVPLGTVKVRLHRGLAMLRRALPVGLTASVALLATPSLGLAAARQAVLAEAAACGVAGAFGAGVILGGWMMKKLVLGAAAIAFAVGGWFAFGLGDAVTPVSAAPEAPAPAVGAVAAAEPKAEVRAVVPAAATTQVAPASERGEAATTGSLDLRVVWASDKAPAAGIELATYQRREQAGRSPVIKRSEYASARSDASGRARFDGLAPGTYHIMATGVKQTSASSRVDVRAGEPTVFEVEVGGDMRLHVTVVGTDGSPRRDATVWCFGANWVDPRLPVGEAEREPYRKLGTTDTSGRLQYRGLPLREVWARVAGSEPSQRHELPPHRAEEVPVEPIEVRLELGPAGCTLVGSVFAPDGRAAAGARVAIACDDVITKPRPEIVLRADEQGAFRCDEVPPGVRNVVATSGDLAPAIVRVTTSSAESATVALQLLHGVTLTGRVVDAAGQPVANAQVSVRRPYVLGVNSVPQLDTRTDADGRYELRGIAPGSFTALVYVEPLLEQKITGADGERVVWNPAQDPERAIFGIVVDDDDKPLARWRVTAMGPANPLRHSTPRPFHTDAEGRFRITGLEDVPHRVFVFAAMEGDRVFTSAAAYVPCTVLDDVRPSGESLAIRVPATAMATAWIEGSLTLPEGMRAKAELSLYPAAIQGRGGFMVPQERLAAGETTYRIGPLPPGEYHLLCDIEGRGRLQQRDLRLAPKETLRLPPFAFDAQRPLVIALRHADGRPATGATVKLETWPVAMPEVAPGSYESIPVGEGDDKITVHGPELAPQSFAVQRGSKTPVEFTVRAATPVVVKLSPMTPRERWVGALRVAVIDAQGQKLVDDMFQLDAGAEFRWRIGLLPGIYTLDFHEMMQGRASTTATVGTEPLQIDLQIAK